MSLLCEALILIGLGWGSCELLPDAMLTPGAIAHRDPAIVCAAGYSREHRPDRETSHQLKLEAMARYHIPAIHSQEYELDALVPICLGGDHYNQANLWLQPWPSARRKDERAEEPACKRVCAVYWHGQHEAARELLLRYQKQFMRDWRLWRIE